jgi:hypothetical protein
MQHSCAFLLCCIFVCAPAFSQDSGTIQCDPRSTTVPAWIGPGRPYVAERLNCGQTVSVIGMGSFPAESQYSQYSSRPREYAKIRIAGKVVYVDAKNVLLSATQGRLPVNQSENGDADRPTIAEEEQKKWDVIAKNDVKLRDETLSEPIYINSAISESRTFTATLSNNSNIALAQIKLLVRLYDCSGKPKSDYSNCEIIGEAEPIVPTSIPSGQTRLITGSALFEATPRVRGTFAWSLRIWGVRVE